MPFTLQVDNVHGFCVYLVTVVVTTASVSWLLLLFLRSIDRKLIRDRKPFAIAMTLQLLFATLRNLSTMLLSSGLALPCRGVAVAGGVLYQFFAISTECAMLIRCRTFTRYPGVVTYLTIPTWGLRLGLCCWLVTTITAEGNMAGQVCNVSMDYTLSAATQYVKVATEIIICGFFLERLLVLHKGSRGISTEDNHNHWRHLALINSGITFLIVISEIIVGQITVYQKEYLMLAYSVVNLIQATLIVFIVEDTKNVFNQRRASTFNLGGHVDRHRKANLPPCDLVSITFAVSQTSIVSPDQDSLTMPKAGALNYRQQGSRDGHLLDRYNCKTDYSMAGHSRHGLQRDEDPTDQAHYATELAMAPACQEGASPSKVEIV